jgi:hypothetical protein
MENAAKKYAELERPIMDLDVVSGIAVQVIEGLLGKLDPSPIGNDYAQITFHRDELDRISFLLLDIDRRTGSLKEAFMSPFKVEAAQ